MTAFEQTTRTLEDLTRRYTASGVAYALAYGLLQQSGTSEEDRALADHLLEWPTVSILADPQCESFPFPSERIREPRKNLVVFLSNGVFDKAMADLRDLTVYLIDEHGGIVDRAAVMRSRTPYNPDAVTDALRSVFGRACEGEANAP